MIASMALKGRAVAARSALHQQNKIAPPLANYFSHATNPKHEDIRLEDTTPTHFKQSSNRHALSIAGLRDDEIVWDNPVHHPVYDLDEIERIDESHRQPKKIHERIARAATWTARSGFDFFTKYKGPGGEMKKEDWLRRCLFLETIAGVPGMVGGMLRHLRSLRTFRRDYGWIHTLLEEAENERMHLLIFMSMRQPGYLFRLNVLAAQGIFFNAFFLTYLVSPKTCHRFVGYLEEEAVHTYTGLLQDIHDGNLPDWNDEVAPKIARTYYKLPEDAKIVDMIKCIRADEANHRDVNHTFADLNQNTGVNPYMVKEMERN